MKNQQAKLRNVDHPYATFIGDGSLKDWEWRVLKRYKSPEREREDQYARWLCAVRSPMTWGQWEYGDVYIRDVPGAVPGMDFSDDAKEAGSCE